MPPRATEFRSSTPATARSSGFAIPVTTSTGLGRSPSFIRRRAWLKWLSATSMPLPPGSRRPQATTRGSATTSTTLARRSSKLSRSASGRCWSRWRPAPARRSRSSTRSTAARIEVSQARPVPRRPARPCRSGGAGVLPRSSRSRDRSSTSSTRCTASGFASEDFGRGRAVRPEGPARQLPDRTRGRAAFVYVCTIQRMAINLFGRRRCSATKTSESEDDAEQARHPDPRLRRGHRRRVPPRLHVGRALRLAEHARPLRRDQDRPDRDAGRAHEGVLQGRRLPLRLRAGGRGGLPGRLRRGDAQVECG